MSIGIPVANFIAHLGALLPLMRGNKGGKAFNELLHFMRFRLRQTTVTIQATSLPRHADDVVISHFFSLNPLSLKRLKHASHFHLNDVPFNEGVLWVAGNLLHVWHTGITFSVDILAPACSRRCSIV
jgi:hypothetical protein